MQLFRLLQSVWIGILPLLLPGPSPGQEAAEPGRQFRKQLGSIHCDLWVPKDRMSLSDQCVVTLRIDGPAPLYVDPPSSVITTMDWRARAMPPKLTRLDGGSERWQQQVELEPFGVGDNVPLQFAPYRIRSGNEIKEWILQWEPISMQVSSSIRDADFSFAKPITSPPSLPDDKRRSSGTWIALVATTLLIMLALAGMYVWRRSRSRGPAKTPLEQSMDLIAQWQRMPSFNSTHLPELAQAIRRVLESHFALPATRYTTQEAISAVQQSNLLPPEQISNLAELLAAADSVKFAGASPGSDVCRGYLKSAHEILTVLAVPIERTVPLEEEKPPR